MSQNFLSQPSPRQPPQARSRGWDDAVVADQHRACDGLQAMGVAPIHEARLHRDDGADGVRDEDQISSAPFKRPGLRATPASKRVLIIGHFFRAILQHV